MKRRKKSRTQPRRITRFLLLLLALAMLTGIGVAGVAATLFARADTTTVGTFSFDNPLQVPPLAASRLDADGRRVFELAARQGETQFEPGRRTATWGVNGSYLGPTLRASRGETVQLNVQNLLPVETTMHWHGMHLPARMDGGPHQRIAPGAVWSPSWRISQPAATLWYHPHPHGATEEHTYRGVAGMFIVDDQNPASAALPRTYGVDDLPVIVQDKKFDEGGQLQFGPGPVSPSGQLGDTILVNGTLRPHHVVTNERVRLRLLNASTARVYNFGFDDSRPFATIASDGGLLFGPAAMTRLRLSPGERAEIIVTVRPGERAILRSYPINLGSNAWNNRFAGGDDTFDILELRAASQLSQSGPIPDPLVKIPRLPSESAVQQRSFQLAGFSINGRQMDHHRIDATVRPGSVEIWAVSNLQETPHNFHIHGVHFQVLEVATAKPPPELQGWKDTVYVPPRTTTTLVVQFQRYADSAVPYMFHCHLLQHEDRGMMGQFIVAPD